MYLLMKKTLININRILFRVLFLILENIKTIRNAASAVLAPAAKRGARGFCVNKL